jgi:hypothetical protein
MRENETMPAAHSGEEMTGTQPRIAFSPPQCGVVAIDMDR